MPFRQSLPTPSDRISRLDDLTAWADGDARVSRKTLEGTPFLKIFDEQTLREGFIHLIAVRRKLLRRRETLIRIKENQYSDPSYASLFQDLDEGDSKDVHFDVTYCVEVGDDVEDYASAVRSWNSLDPKDNVRRLRFTIQAAAFLNARMRAALSDLSNAIAVAQGDIEPEDKMGSENKENIG